MQTLNTEELLQQLRDTSEELLNTLNLFTEEQFNTVPFEGSWTAAQVAEHLYKSETGISGLLNSTVEEANRPADEKLVQLKTVFLDFTIRFESSESLRPSIKPQNKTELIDILRKNKETIIEMAGNTDLSQICTARKMPVVGELTRYEWLWFVVFHNTRHLRQLKNIHSTFSQS